MEPPASHSDARYGFDSLAYRYRDRATGRFVSWSAVQQSMYEFLDRAEGEATAASQALRKGTITVAEYESRMMTLIKNSRLTEAALAKGGWQQMTQADFGRVGQDVRRQYDFLAGRVQAILSGRQALDGTLDARSRQYVQTAKTLFHRVRAREERLRGRTRVRSVLDPLAESCHADKRPGCIEEAARGWLPIERLFESGALRLSVPGERTCLGNDRCEVEFG